MAISTVSVRQSAHAATGGGCPLRKLLGPFAPLVFKDMGPAKCPAAIVQMRAALSRTQLIRQLRPQETSIKLFAVFAISMIANVPFGGVREHVAKYSLGWFVAIHASVPFVAMLRKAVFLPKYAILLTIVGSVTGQLLGARAERYRMRLAEPQTKISQAIKRYDRSHEANSGKALDQVISEQQMASVAA